ncbi:hypothetical protein BJ165DRAFT_1534522 [Panaeolus papilionaceus]|nr:hypothetical protein BJ165DRAFT_1534522 [Panaeolus papilionaceus]
MTNEEFINLFKKNVIPLYVVFVTLEDEVNYVWKKKLNLGRGLYLWIRYYTILLLIFDAVQIHSFAIPGVATKSVCLAMDPTIRVVGAVSLWTIQIIMQLRIYALFNRSRKLALFNAFFFFLSILGFLIILIVNAIRRPALIAKAVGLPLPGCPVVNGLVQWAQWIPATVFELIMFTQALYKSFTSLSARIKLKQRVSLEEVMLGDHILYFLGISVLLVFNNMMVITGVTRIPWFGLAPFHASMGIMTCRMLLHLFKFTSNNLEGGLKSCGGIRTDVWRGLELDVDDLSDARDTADRYTGGDGVDAWRNLDMEDMWRNVEGGEGGMREVGGGVMSGKGKGKMRDSYGSASECVFDASGGMDSRRTSSMVTLTASHSRTGSNSSGLSSQLHNVWEVEEGAPEGRRGSDGTLVEVVMASLEDLKVSKGSNSLEGGPADNDSEENSPLIFVSEFQDRNFNSEPRIPLCKAAAIMSTITDQQFITLFKKNLIPLYVVLPCLVWVLHDYFIKLEEEVKYVWGKQLNLGKGLYLWIRYYTILLLLFDAVQIHSFAIPGVATKSVCLAMDPTIRVVGAVSLWSIEIIMQLRIYALYNRSKKIAIFNALCFLLSIAAFMIILIINAIRRPALIAKAIGLPLPGCPVVNGLVQWAQWIPATVFELIMFTEALYKSLTSLSKRLKLKQRVSLEEVLLGDHILYFFGIFILLIFNNMMVITGVTRIPWFGLAPFHASMGIMTCRMLLNLLKFTSDNLQGGLKSCGGIRTDVWQGVGDQLGDEKNGSALHAGGVNNERKPPGLREALQKHAYYHNIGECLN